jgi:hypothetical protein
MKLVWGEGPPMFDLGVSQGVLYLDNGAVPWSGLVGVDEKETGSVDTEHYFDGNRIHISQELGDFEATISAYTYPEVFAEYNGFSEVDEHRRFGFSYRTEHGDIYAIHLVYNVLVRDDARSWNTMNETADPSLFNWSIYSSAVDVPLALPTGHLVMEAPRDPSVFERLEDILYGTDTTEPRLPDPAEIIELYEAATLLRITYNGDGTYTASGPDDMVRVLEDGRFEINAPSAFLINEDIFTVQSY